MKKSILVLLSFILVFGLFAALPAASESKESEFYYVNVPILKIFPCKLGYYVIYRRAGLQTGEYYIPQKWLDRRDSRAVMNLTEQNVSPYLSIMMKNGEFDHVRIVASKDINHPTWGQINQSSIPAEKFNVEKLALEF
ncbi:MAG TPA: hypothetical protein PKL75_06855 [Treponemataceae bacterium]|nr:hypothetical protein [Treponemataceae bacterium]